MFLSLHFLLSPSSSYERLYYALTVIHLSRYFPAETPDSRHKVPASVSAVQTDSSPLVLGTATNAQSGGAMGYFTSAKNIDVCLPGPSGGHFIRRSVDTRVEDPFIEKDGSSSTDPFPGEARETSPLHRRTQSTTALARSEAGMIYSPRADRLGQPLSPANAQGVLPPDACVFVAK